MLVAGKHLVFNVVLGMLEFAYIVVVGSYPCQQPVGTNLFSTCLSQRSYSDAVVVRSGRFQRESTEYRAIEV